MSGLSMCLSGAKHKPLEPEALNEPETFVTVPCSVCPCEMPNPTAYNLETLYA